MQTVWSLSSAFFSKLGDYSLPWCNGGDWNTLVQKLGVSEARAKAAYADFVKRYPGIGKARNKTFDAFCSMRQPAGIGSAVVWASPAEYVETFLGFRRLLFTGKQDLQGPVRAGPQRSGTLAGVTGQGQCRAIACRLAGGAVSSAASMVPPSKCRPPTCGPPRTTKSKAPERITKSVQRRLWDLQPAGVHPLMLAPLNVHDKLMVVAMPSIVPGITESVREVVESFRGHVPLIGMTWYEGMDNWAEKKGGAAPVKIRAPEMM